MKIGFAQKDITPPAGVLMAGQPFECRATGVDSRLQANVLYLDDGRTPVLIVSADTLLIPNDWVEDLTTRAGALTGIPARQILLTATHTHSGPATAEVLGASRILRYKTFLSDQIIAAGIQAIGQARAGRLSVATGEVRGLAFNRRFIMSDGTVETHPLKGNPHVVCAEGPDSTHLAVWRASDTAGCAIGGMLKFGCHATVMRRKNRLISSDYPGRAAAYVAARLGKGAGALFLQGACGNICQVNPRNLDRREVGRAWVHTMGDTLGRRAVDLMARAIPARGPLRVMEETLRLARRAVEPDLLAWARRHRYAPGEGPELSDYGVEHYGEDSGPACSLADYFKTPYWANAFAREIRAAERLRKEQSSVPFRLKVIAQDNWALVAIPAELFVELGLAIEKRSPFEHTAVVELANGWNGYVPTPQAFRRQGGYETLPLTSSSLAVSAGEQIVDRAIMLLKRSKR